VLLYFRPREFWVRPFLSVGTGVTHLAVDGSPGGFSATRPALHTAVGIDLKGARGWRFRYSFAETISGNPISRQLAPPASRRLAAFRNLFGFAKYF
jgi:hypothetical protein